MPDLAAKGRGGRGSQNHHVRSPRKHFRARRGAVARGRASAHIRRPVNFRPGPRIAARAACEVCVSSSSPVHRTARHHRLRPRRLHRRDLCRARDAAAAAAVRLRARRPADDHHRRRELSRLRRADPGAVADGADARPGRACRRAAGERACRGARSVGAAVSRQMRQRARRARRRRDHSGDRRQGEMAGLAERGGAEGLRRLGLRDLRRLLLPRQEGARRRRRQFGGRGGAVSLAASPRR